MKKTVSVNIKGINFLIEEDAYELLQDYMDRLTIALKNEDGSKEIIEDVELRIAEICAEKLSETKTVIELNEIEEILAALGNPEEYVDEEENEQAFNREASSEQTRSSDNSGKGDRRLFRDGDAATIGGVCAGIANYFAIDVVIIRAIFLVFLLFGGFGLPLYIILWIIIPKAVSTIDKLRMKGRPITVESVKQEVGDAAERVKSESKSFADKIRHDQSYKKRITRGRRILASIVGIWFMGVGLLFSIMFTVFIVSGFQFLPFDGASGYMSITEFGKLVLSNPSDVKYAWMGGLMISLSAIVFCFLLGSILLFRIKNKWSKWTLGGLFLTGICGLLMTASLGVRTARDFSYDGEVERLVGTTPAEKQLVVIPRLKGYDGNEVYRVKRNGGLMNMEVGEHSIKTYGIEIEYASSTDTAFHVYQNLSAHSSSRRSAERKSKNIEHSVELIGDTLFVDVEYSFPREDKLRDQDVTIIIEVPDGKMVRWKNRAVTLPKSGITKDGVTYIDHKEYGRISSDGEYYHYNEWDHNHNCNSRHHHFDDDNSIEREIKEDILEELDLN